MLWTILAHQGRSLQWLARRTRYSESHIWAIKGGRAAVTPEFRARCAEALDLPVDVLFQIDDSSASASDDSNGSKIGAGTAVRAQPYRTEEAASLSQTA